MPTGTEAEEVARQAVAQQALQNLPDIIQSAMHLSPGTVILGLMPWIAVISAIVGVLYFRFARRRETEKTIRAAIEHGQNLDVQVIQALVTPPVGHQRSPGLRLLVAGVLLISFGIGLAGMNVFLKDDTRPAAVLFIALGVGFVVASHLVKRTVRKL